MYPLSSYERLVESATLIAHHPDGPMKRRVLDQCGHEVSDLLRAGRIDPEQARVILTILGNDAGSPPGRDARQGVSSEGLRMPCR